MTKQVSAKSKMAVAKSKGPIKEKSSKTRKPTKPAERVSAPQTASRPKRYRSNHISPAQWRRLERRLRIMMAARKLFLLQGYDNTRPADIVAEADVAYGTFYDNFESKEQCFAEVIEDIADEVNQVVRWYLPPIDPHKSRQPQAFIRGIIEGSLSYSSIHPNSLKTMFTKHQSLHETNEETVQRLATGWIERIDKWKASGAVTSTYKSSLLADLITAVIKLGEELVAKNADNEQEIISTLTGFVVAALNERIQ